MYTVFAILIIITSILLVLIVLVKILKEADYHLHLVEVEGIKLWELKQPTFRKATWTLAITLIVLSLISNLQFQDKILKKLLKLSARTN